MVFHSWMFTGSWSQAIHMFGGAGGPQRQPTMPSIFGSESTSAAFSISSCHGLWQLYTETDGRTKNAKKWPTQLVFILPKSHREPVYVASSNTSIVFSVHFWELPILVSFVFFWDTSTSDFPINWQVRSVCIEFSFTPRAV